MRVSKASIKQVSKTGLKTGLIRGFQRRLVCGQHRIRLVAQRPPMQPGGTPATRFAPERNQMKDKKMSIRISEDDLSIVHYKAEQAKLTLTEYVTQCVLGKQIFVIDGLDKVLRQQKAIGKNLNRLTVLSNMGKISSVNLQELTKEYAALNRTLIELLDRKRWVA